MKKSGLFTFVFIIAVSCLNEPDCYQLNNNTVVIYFKIIGGGNDHSLLTTAQSPETDSIFNSVASAPKIILPLNPKSEETLYTLQRDNNSNTLQFGYTRQVQFVSEACGERYYFQNLQVLNHDFDSVRVVNAIPTPEPEPAGANNLEIYRCATTNLMGIRFSEETFVQEITADFTTTDLLPDGLLQDFVLPLNVNDSISTFQFNFGVESRTLRIRYLRTPRTIADMCGEQTMLSELHVNSVVTDFTEVEISKDSIQDLPVMNLEITPP